MILSGEWSEGLQQHLPIDLAEGGEADDFVQWDWKKRLDDFKKFHRLLCKQLH